MNGNAAFETTLLQLKDAECSTDMAGIILSMWCLDLTGMLQLLQYSLFCMSPHASDLASMWFLDLTGMLYLCALCLLCQHTSCGKML